MRHTLCTSFRLLCAVAHRSACTCVRACGSSEYCGRLCEPVAPPALNLSPRAFGLPLFKCKLYARSCARGGRILMRHASTTLARVQDYIEVRDVNNEVMRAWFDDRAEAREALLMVPQLESAIDPEVDRTNLPWKYKDEEIYYDKDYSADG